MFCSLFNRPLSNLDYVVSNDQKEVKCELERMWNEVVKA
jgi:hypothetical protein